MTNEPLRPRDENERLAWRMLEVAEEHEAFALERLEVGDHYGHALHMEAAESLREFLRDVAESYLIRKMEAAIAWSGKLPDTHGAK